MATATGTRNRVVELTGGDANESTMMGMFHRLNQQHCMDRSVSHVDKMIIFTMPGPDEDADPVVHQLLVDTSAFQAGNNEVWAITGRWITDLRSDEFELFTGTYDVPTRTASLMTYLRRR